jgi:hypothetical protein
MCCCKMCNCEYVIENMCYCGSVEYVIDKVIGVVGKIEEKENENQEKGRTRTDGRRTRAGTGTKGPSLCYTTCTKGLHLNYRFLSTGWTTSTKEA